MHAVDVSRILSRVTLHTTMSYFSLQSFILGWNTRARVSQSFQCTLIRSGESLAKTRISYTWFPLIRSIHFSVTAISFRDDYLERVFHQGRKIGESCIHVVVFHCSASPCLVSGIEERTTPVALEINPLHVVESCGLSSRSRTKALGFVLSARVSDFWWHAGTHAHSMVYLIKITPTPY